MINKLFKQSVVETVKNLKSGKVCLLPTDTVWGLSTIFDNETAVQNIYKIKGRDKSKPVILLVANVKMLEKYIPKSLLQNEKIKNILKSDDPTTIIYEKTKNIPEFLLANDGTIGIRVVREGLPIQKIIEILQIPITSTSANISGQNTPLSFETIDIIIKQKVDYIYPQHLSDKCQSPPSRIVKIENGDIFYIR